MTSLSRIIALLAVVFFLVPARIASAAEFVVGVGVHAGQGRLLADRAKPLIGVGKLNSFRDDMSWRRIEVAPANLAVGADLAELDELVRWGKDRAKALLILDYGNPLYDGGSHPTTDEGRAAFSRYAEFVAKRYKGSVFGFEIWNEWNIGLGKVPRSSRWGDPADYVALVRETSPRIRKVAPEAKIVCGAIADRDDRWLEAILKAGVLEWCDAVSVHPYVFSERQRSLPRDAFAWVDSAKTRIDRYSGGKRMPVLITELGWPNHIGKAGHAELRVAAYAAQSLLLARMRDWIDGLWWYELLDGGVAPSDKEMNFGLVRYGSEAKPVYNIFLKLAEPIRTGRLMSRSALGASKQWIKLELVDDLEMTAVWSASGAPVVFRLNRLPKSSLVNVVLGDIPYLSEGSVLVSVGEMPLVIVHPKGYVNVN